MCLGVLGTAVDTESAGILWVRWIYCVVVGQLGGGSPRQGSSLSPSLLSASCPPPNMIAENGSEKIVLELGVSRSKETPMAVEV